MKPLTLEEIILLKERFSNGQHTTRGQVALLIETARAAMKVVECLKKVVVVGTRKPDGWDELDKAFAPFRQEKK